jgi:hypothetical protein
MRKIQPLFLVLLIGLWLPAFALVVSLFGCQTGSTGLLRPLSDNVNHGITNTVAIVTTQAAAVAPQPYATAIEASGAAVLALLAAWQGLTHSKVKTLEANNPVVNAAPKI